MPGRVAPAGITQRMDRPPFSRLREQGVCHRPRLSPGDTCVDRRRGADEPVTLAGGARAPRHLRRRDQIASGWFSGRAASKAGSARQASSIRDRVG